MADELIRLDTTIIGIDSLINKASTAEEAKALFAAKDVIYSQQRYITDTKPVKCGRWIRTDKSMGVETVYACSECGYLVRESDKTNYCGDCGSKMDIVYQNDKITAIKVTGW